MVAKVRSGMDLGEVTFQLSDAVTLPALGPVTCTSKRLDKYAVRRNQTRVNPKM
jgi:hypothetical protein